MELDQEPEVASEDSQVANAIVMQVNSSEFNEAEKKLLEEKLRESEWRYRTMFEQAAVGMAHTGLDGQLLEVNRRFCDITGYTCEELLHRRFHDITHPDYLEASLASRARLLTGEAQTYSMEKRYIRKDGSLVWALVTVSLISTPSNEPKYFVVVVEDINERKQLEQRTREALDSLLKMAEAIVQLPVSTTDVESTSIVRDTSPEVSRVEQRLVELIRTILGCQRVSITTVDPQKGELRSVAVVGLSPELESQWRARLPGFHLSEQLTGSKIGSRLQKNEVLVLDMTQPPFSDQTNPYSIRTMLLAPMYEGDQLVGLLSLDHGGTKHEYAEEEIALTGAIAKLAALVIERERLLQERAEAQANELALREANRRMDEFLSIVSHELRTPLTTIKANVQLAQRRLRGIARQEAADVGDVASRFDVVQELLERAVRQVGVLNRLVSDLLDISRIQADKLELRLRPEPCDLAAIVREVVEVQRQVSSTRSIRLKISFRKAVPVIADADRIVQVVTNYLSNALKYSPEDRLVEVSLQVKEQVARVSVRDEGPGLPMSEQERIWERFYQAPRIEKQDNSSVGLGLGLHISRIIIERHQGQVGVESEPGKGSTFWFTLPLASKDYEESE